MSRKRQMEKQEETRRIILNAAKIIIDKHGLEGLSIRKITNEIDYSPAIVYHYFKDKDEIVATLVEEGYGRIIDTISKGKIEGSNPLEQIKITFIKYINASLESPSEYKAFMLSENETILNKTSILRRGISKESPTIGALVRNIERGIEDGLIRPCDAELTAQIIWTSTFGLLMKLILEKNIEEEQKDRLIEEHFKLIFNGIVIGKGK